MVGPERFHRPVFSAVFFLALLVISLFPAPAGAADCTGTSVGFIPLTDLGSGKYLGQFTGGLYQGGSNRVPPAHASAGLVRAEGIGPLDAAGNPDPAGKFVLLSIGMSNTTQEFCSKSSFEPCDAWTFMGQAAAEPTVNHATLVIINGARGGQAAGTWESPVAANYDRILTDQLAPKGLSETQVRVVWVKQANPSPTVSLPDAMADAFRLEASLGNIARAVKMRYPNCTIMFLSSRIYAGYASTALNPEPFAYESAFSVKGLIRAQIDQMADGRIDPTAGDLDYTTTAPWLAWGPYMWADGLTPRGDGLVWKCSDMESDGTHPATSAERKVGTMLLDFMLTSEFATPWFLSPANGPQPAPVPALSVKGAAVLVVLLLAAGAVLVRRAMRSVSA